MSFTILKNMKANILNIVNIAKLYSHGSIFFSYSFRKALINKIDVTHITNPPSIENSAKTIRAFRTGNKFYNN